MQAIGYIRVSTDKQVAEGVSLDNQRQRIEAYCKFKGMDLLETIEDAGISGGKNHDRAGFMRLLSVVEERKVGSVVIYSVERLSRDMLTLLALERLFNEYDCELHTVDGLIDTSGPDGFMNYAMRAFLGEMERRQIRHRVRSALQHKKANGDVVGSVPYGFRREGDSVVECQEEQAVMVLANELYSQKLSLVRIADRLNADGRIARNGKRFDSTQIKRMIAGYQPTRKARPSELGETIKRFIEQLL